MAEPGTMRMPISCATRNVTLNVEVTGLRVFRWRMWLTTQIIRFGIWVSGMRGNVKVGSEDG